jgi:hypothetical protein
VEDPSGGLLTRYSTPIKKCSPVINGSITICYRQRKREEKLQKNMNRNRGKQGKKNKMG